MWRRGPPLRPWQEEVTDGLRQLPVSGACDGGSSQLFTVSDSPSDLPSDSSSELNCSLARNIIWIITIDSSCLSYPDPGIRCAISELHPGPRCTTHWPVLPRNRTLGHFSSGKLTRSSRLLIHHNAEALHTHMLHSVSSKSSYFVSERLLFPSSASPALLSTGRLRR